MRREGFLRVVWALAFWVGLSVAAFVFDRIELVGEKRPTFEWQYLPYYVTALLGVCTLFWLIYKTVLYVIGGFKK